MTALSPSANVNTAVRRRYPKIPFIHSNYAGQTVMRLRDAIALIAPDLDETRSRRYETREQKQRRKAI